MSSEKKSEGTLKDSWVHIRVSQYDRARIHAAARSQGIKLSKFIRRLIDNELLDYEKSKKLFSDAEEYLNGDLN